MKNRLTLEERAQGIELASPDLTDVRIALGFQLATYRKAFYSRRNGVKFPNPDVVMALVAHNDSFLRAVEVLNDDEILLRDITTQELDAYLHRSSLVFRGLKHKPHFTYDIDLRTPLESDSHLVYTVLADMLQYVQRIVDSKDGRISVKIYHFSDPKGKLFGAPNDFVAFDVRGENVEYIPTFTHETLEALSSGYAALVSKALGGHLIIDPRRERIVDVTFYHPISRQAILEPRVADSAPIIAR